MPFAIEFAEKALAPDRDYLGIHHLARQVVLQARNEIVNPYIYFISLV